MSANARALVTSPASVSRVEVGRLTGDLR